MKRTTLFLLAAVVLAGSACARSPGENQTQAKAVTAAANTAPASPETSNAIPVMGPRLASVLVHKSPTCGCCELWVDHLREAGFEVSVQNHDNLNPIKERLGVPYGKGSCHTAEVDGYVIEGHVPAQDIKRLLSEKPEGRGLVLPGMPLGSPGMEVPDGRVQPYTVELVKPDGTTVAYASHGGTERAK